MCQAWKQKIRYPDYTLRRPGQVGEVPFHILFIRQTFFSECFQKRYGVTVLSFFAVLPFVQLL